jgi:hypothetical protein
MNAIKKFTNKKTELDKIHGGATDDYWQGTVASDKSYKDERYMTTAEEGGTTGGKQDGKRYFCD